MFKTFLLNTAFNYVKDNLLSDENIEDLRDEFKYHVEVMVQDTENEWDDHAAKALFGFMGFDRN